MPFAFCPRTFADGSIDAHLLILSRVWLSLIRGAGPVGEIVAPKSLEVEFPFPRGGGGLSNVFHMTAISPQRPRTYW